MLLPAHVLRVYVAQCRGGLNVVCRALRREPGRYMEVAGIVYTGSRCRGLKSMDVKCMDMRVSCTSISLLASLIVQFVSSYVSCLFPRRFCRVRYSSGYIVRAHYKLFVVQAQQLFAFVSRAKSSIFVKSQDSMQS